MAAHKNRQGRVLVSFLCKEGDHDNCDEAMHELDDHMVCHCHCHNRTCH
jgi:hypothetical protein